MRTDKAALHVGEETYAQRAVRTLSAGLRPVMVVTNDSAPFEGLSVTCVADHPERRDPMGAILTGWERLQAAEVFVAAVDMPGLDAAVIGRLMRVASEHPEDAIVAPSGIRGYEPLHALYRASAIPVMRRRHAEGMRSLQGLMEDLPVRCVPRDALAAGPWAFRSVNTPEDLASWEKSGGA